MYPKRNIYRLFFFVALFCTAIGGAQQSSLKNADEVKEAERSLSASEQDTKTADRYFDLCFWYLNNASDQIQKIESYSQAGYRISKKQDYKNGLGKYWLTVSHLKQIAHDYPQGIKAAERAIPYFQLSGNNDLTGESWVMIWSNNCLSGLAFDKRNPYLLKAATFFDMARNYKREADCFKECGDVYQILGKGAESLDCIKKAVTFYKKAHYDRLHESYDLLGKIYGALGDHKQAIRYGLLAAKTGETLGDESIMMCTIYNRLGSSYVMIEQLDKGLEYYAKSLAYAERYNDIANIGAVVFNIAEVKIHQKKPQEALDFTNGMIQKFPTLETVSGDMDCLMFHLYWELHRVDESRKYAVKIEKQLLQGEPSYVGYTNSVNLLLALYINTKEYAKAKVWLDRYDSVCKNTDTETNREKLYYWKFKLDSVNGDFKGAIKNYQLYNKWTQKGLIESKSRQINQLSVLYETEKKDKDILILKRKSTLQQASIAKEKLTKNIILAGLILLVFILFLLYKGYRLKQKSNKQLEKQKLEINDKNASLEQLVHEKEWLLREIHHRVKNNLHMVTGLLESQTEFIKGKEAKMAIANSQNRVQAMSLIHQKLYQTENMSLTDMPSYISELVDYLQQVSESSEGIRFVLDVDKVEFPLSHTLPIGLILNEAITNSIKYAFKKGDEKIISIALKTLSEHRFLLEISDNGVGLPEGFDYQNPDSLGTRLIYGLSQDIHADIEMFSQNGTHIRLTFNLPNH